MNKPPYSITSSVLNLISGISEKVGAVRAVRLDRPSARFQKSNSVRTVQSSLEIEGNTLGVDQIAAILDGKRVVGPARDVLEAENAVRVYGQLDRWKPFALKSLCEAHGMLMKGLVERPGEFRTAAVGIVKGRKVAHLAPGAEMVPPLLENLLSYARTDPDNLLVKSCVFHYEFEFVHPFVDGNGRIGRLWQTLLLCRYDPLFEHLPVDPLINFRRDDYYAALSASDKEGSSTAFLEFMLHIIDAALGEVLLQRPTTLNSEGRIEQFADKVGDEEFSRKDYMRHFKEISPATASRDLKSAVDSGVLARSGDKRTARYRYRG